MEKLQGKGKNRKQKHMTKKAVEKNTETYGEQSRGEEHGNEGKESGVEKEIETREKEAV